MAPVRRYLRISKYSVLECRIYVDNPAQVHTWLLNPRNPILPRVIESIRPLVLPKLREERERAKKKSSKKKNIKDVVVQGTDATSFVPSLTCADDFEVSMFLTETNTRHSILTKHKSFRDRGSERMQSNSTKLLSGDSAEPIDVDAASDVSVRQEEESDDEGFRLADIPTADASRASRRTRSETRGDREPRSSDEDDAPIEVDSDEEPPLGERPRAAVGDDDDKKKMTMDVSYEGFAIYGRVLCLVVKKRESKSAMGKTPRAAGNQAGGQARMENWISSTQMPQEELEG